MFSRPLIKKIRVLLILLLALTVNGCGQKGDLYLPDDEATGARLRDAGESLLV